MKKPKAHVTRPRAPMQKIITRFGLKVLKFPHKLSNVKLTSLERRYVRPPHHEPDRRDPRPRRDDRRHRTHPEDRPPEFRPGWLRHRPDSSHDGGDHDQRACRPGRKARHSPQA